MTTRSVLGCIVAVVIGAPLSLARAQASRINFSASEGTPQYQPLNPLFYPDIKMQMVMYSDTSGTTIVDQYDCSILTNCVPGRNGAFGSYRATFSLPPDTNVEMVASTCGGTDPGVTTCFDAPLLVTLRVKVGRNRIELIGSDSGKPAIVTAGVDLKFLIGGNPNAFWQTGNSGANRFPQGTWNPVVTAMPTGNCHPEPVDPNFSVTVTDDLAAPIVYWPWRGTVCDYYVLSLDGGGTVTNSSGTFTCVMPRGVETRCDFSVPYGEEAVLTATSDTYNPVFKQIGNTPCSASEPDQVCRFTSDEDSEISISFSTISNPVSVTASAGARGPASGAAAKGATNVAVQQVRVTPNGSPAITTMTLTAGGTGAPQADIIAAKVFIDVNSNGAVDEADFQLGAGTFASNGTSVVTFDEPYQFNTATDLVVAVDVNSTIQAAIWFPGAPWSLLLVIVLPVVLMRRRRGLVLGLGIVLVAVATSVACGGGGGGGDDDGDGDQQQGDNNGNGDGDGDVGATDDDYIPPAGSKTYAFSISAMAAQQSYSTTTPAVVNGLPLSGATLSVEP